MKPARRCSRCAGADFHVPPGATPDRLECSECNEPPAGSAYYALVSDQGRMRWQLVSVMPAMPVEPWKPIETDTEPPSESQQPTATVMVGTNLDILTSTPYVADRPDLTINGTSYRQLDRDWFAWLVVQVRRLPTSKLNEAMAELRQVAFVACNFGCGDWLAIESTWPDIIPDGYVAPSDVFDWVTRWRTWRPGWKPI